MQLIKKISIDINKKTYQEIKAKQNDIGRFIEFSLYVDGISLNITNNTVKIFGKKSDGTIIFNNLTATDAVKGIVLAELTSQALVRSGNLEAELVIYGADGTEISSIPFVIVVEKSIRDDSAIESQNEFTALSEAMQSLAEYDAYKQKVNDLESDKLDKDGDSKDNTTTFTIAATEEDIVSEEEHSVLFGKILKSISTFRDGLANKISTNKMVNTTAVTEAGFVPDALLVKENAQAIDTLNNNLANNKANAMIVTRDPALASSVQTVVTSFKPKSIMIFGHLENMDCRGFWAENNVQRVSAKDAATGNYTGQGDAILLKNGTNNIKGTIQNVTDTGFEINWIKTGSLAGDIIALNILIF